MTKKYWKFLDDESEYNYFVECDKDDEGAETSHEIWLFSLFDSFFDEIFYEYFESVYSGYKKVDGDLAEKLWGYADAINGEFLEKARSIVPFDKDTSNPALFDKAVSDNKESLSEIAKRIINKRLADFFLELSRD